MRRLRGHARTAAACTCEKKGRLLHLLRRWPYSDDVFRLGPGEQQNFHSGEHLPVLEGRLFLASMTACPVARPLEYYLTLNKKLRYIPFCADFGASRANVSTCAPHAAPPPHPPKQPHPHHTMLCCPACSSSRLPHRALQPWHDTPRVHNPEKPAQKPRVRNDQDHLLHVHRAERYHQCHLSVRYGNTHTTCASVCLSVCVRLCACACVRVCLLCDTLGTQDTCVCVCVRARARVRACVCARVHLCTGTQRR